MTNWKYSFLLLPRTDMVLPQLEEHAVSLRFECTPLAFPVDSIGGPAAAINRLLLDLLTARP